MPGGVFLTSSVSTVISPPRKISNIVFAIESPIPFIDASFSVGMS